MTVAVKERPILFSAPMVRALLDGTKTQTRRVVRPGSKFAGRAIAGVKGPLPSLGFVFDLAEPMELPNGAGRTIAFAEQCPYGAPRDRLWVITVKPIAGFENRYGAGDDGRIYRTDLPEPRPMRPGVTSKGYETVTLCERGARQTRAVHELVCRSFYGSPSIVQFGRPDIEVRHLDGNPRNNVPENLDWGTPTQNRADRESLGRGSGESHHAAKLTSAAVEAIRASSASQRALARQYGVSQSTIGGVRTGMTWTGREAPPPNMPRWASRITLELTDVRVERVQDISDSDALAEGVDYEWHGVPVGQRDSFRALWDSINGERESWASNRGCGA